MGLRLKLARILLRGSGHVVMPRKLTQDMRAATWMAQYLHRRERSAPEASRDHCGRLTWLRVSDPVQQEQDEAAYDAMVGQVEGSVTITYCDAVDRKEATPNDRG